LVKRSSAPVSGSCRAAAEARRRRRRCSWHAVAAKCSSLAYPMVLREAGWILLNTMPLGPSPSRALTSIAASLVGMPVSERGRQAVTGACRYADMQHSGSVGAVRARMAVAGCQVHKVNHLRGAQVATTWLKRSMKALSTFSPLDAEVSKYLICAKQDLIRGLQERRGPTDSKEHRNSIELGTAERWAHAPKAFGCGPCLPVLLRYRAFLAVHLLCQHANLPSVHRPRSGDGR
jgi:hypothetical protein